MDPKNIKEKILTFLILFAFVFPLARIVWQKWDYYLSPFDWEEKEYLYSVSQYVKKGGAWFADEVLYSYAGWYYVNGGSPILVNPENPPLGKYIVGFSIKLFNNEKLPSLLFAFLSLGSFFLLNRLFLKKIWLALLPVAFFAWGRLFQEQLVFLPLFELFYLAFLNLALYFFIKGEKKSIYFLLANLFLGLLWATKPWVLTAPLVASWLVYLSLIKKDLRETVFWLASLPIAVIVLIISYSRLLFEGWSLYKILSVQKWILWYHQSKLIKFGSVWPFIYLKRWYVWWGDKAYQTVNQWNIFWPISTTLALVFSALVLLKAFGLKKKVLTEFNFDRRMAILCLWMVFYLALLSIGNITARYVFYLLPFCYLLGIYFLKEVWIFFKTKKPLDQPKLELVEDELAHLFLALVGGLVLKTVYQDWRLVAAALVFGFFIDIDHWFDYFVFFGPKINLRKFFKVDQYMRPSKKIYVPLHGWEYVVLFWLAGRWFGVAGLEWAMSLPYLIHLLWDNFTSKRHRLAYFFTYRLLNKFSLKSFNKRK